jgi:hypothetical protein
VADLRSQGQERVIDRWSEKPCQAVRRWDISNRAVKVRLAAAFTRKFKLTEPTHSRQCQHKITGFKGCSPVATEVISYITALGRQIEYLSGFVTQVTSAKLEQAWS